VRESPAIALVECLIKEGCSVDRLLIRPAMDKCEQVLNSSIIYAESSYAAAKDADAVLILTDWRVRRARPGRLKTALKFPS